MLPRHAPRSYYVVLALASCAVTSLGINSINMRDRHQTERARLNTQRSVLHELIERYRRGERVPENEEERLLRLANLKRANDDDVQKTTVMQAIFGRKPAAVDEEKEMQMLVEIWEEALRDDDQRKNTLS